MTLLWDVGICLRPVAFIKRIARVGSRVLTHGNVWHSVGVVAELVAALITLIVSCHQGHDPATAKVPPAPPGRVVTDDGRAFGGPGSSRFTVTIDPANTGVRLTRRLDAGIPMQTASITVNGTMAGRWAPLPAEFTYRWKDQSIDIPARLTASRDSLTIANRFISSDLDFNEFTYLVDQQINGVWSRADTVDVGPDHPTDEAKHRYRLTGQTWAGVRTFKYPR